MGSSFSSLTMTETYEQTRGESMPHRVGRCSSDAVEEMERERDGASEQREREVWTCERGCSLYLFRVPQNVDEDVVGEDIELLLVLAALVGGAA